MKYMELIELYILSCIIPNTSSFEFYIFNSFLSDWIEFYIFNSFEPDSNAVHLL